MKDDVFNYLDQVVEPVKGGFIRCKATAGNDAVMHFTCGSITGLITFKFPSISHKEAILMHQEYIETRGPLWRAKGICKEIARLFGF